MQKETKLYEYTDKEIDRMHERIQEFLTQLIVNIDIARGERYNGHIKYTRKALGDATKQCHLLKREIEALLEAYNHYN